METPPNRESLVRQAAPPSFTRTSHYSPAWFAKPAKTLPPPCAITTIAGNGSEILADPIRGIGYGDGEPATEAALNRPEAVAVAANGDVYIADTGNHLVRRIDRSGIITTVAGNGKDGPAVDGALATQTSLSAPHGIALDALGNLYITQGYLPEPKAIGDPSRGNPSAANILKVDPSGIIRKTVTSGSMTYSYKFDEELAPLSQAPYVPNPAWGVAASRTDLYYSYPFAGIVRRKSISESLQDQAGAFAGVPADRINVWIAAGDGGAAAKAALFYPRGLAADGEGNLYIADTGNNRIRKVAPGGIISTFAGVNQITENLGNCKQAAAFGMLNGPEGVAVDRHRTLYLADTGNHRIRKIDADGIITDFAGDGRHYFSGDGDDARQVALNGPRGVAIDGGGNVFIADTGNNRIRKVVCPTGAETAVPYPSQASMAWNAPKEDTPSRFTATPFSMDKNPAAAIRAPRANADGLSFRVTAEPWQKDAPYTFDPNLFSKGSINFTATMTNNSDQPVTVSTYALTTIKLTEQSEEKNSLSIHDDKIIDFYVDPGRAAAAALVTLQPGEKVTTPIYQMGGCRGRDFRRVDACLDEQPLPPTCRTYGIDHPDNYNLSFSYSYDGPDEKEVWDDETMVIQKTKMPNVFRGRLVSPEVTIHVVR